MDNGGEIFVWVGKGATDAERKGGMKAGTEYCARDGRPKGTRVTKVMEGAEPTTFKANFEQWGARWYRSRSHATFPSRVLCSAAKRAAKRKKQLAYVKRFGKIAQTEMEKYGIPASITLAQGLLESNVGLSRLATKNNNHFGIKCFSKSCRKGHCSNFTDDSHKDFFRKYKSTWESYRAHSKLLCAKRYAKLYKLKKTDYAAWAKGLKKAGYATDPRYAEKIIALIENLDLNQYDK